MAQTGDKRSLGIIGEGIAADFLSKNGYRIINKNFRAGRYGEIDIIALDNEYICFIEVKTRSSTLFGAPSEAVNKRKQDNIRMLSVIYITKHKLNNVNMRYDIVEIITSKKTAANVEARINLIKNAF